MNKLLRWRETGLISSHAFEEKVEKLLNIGSPEWQRCSYCNKWVLIDEIKCEIKMDWDLYRGPFEHVFCRKAEDHEKACYDLWVNRV